MKAGILYGYLHFHSGMNEKEGKEGPCPTCLCEQQKDILSVIFTLFPPDFGRARSILAAQEAESPRN